jgi:hypothetical protein
MVRPLAAGIRHEVVFRVASSGLSFRRIRQDAFPPEGELSRELLWWKGLQGLARATGIPIPSLHGPLGWAQTRADVAVVGWRQREGQSHDVVFSGCVELRLDLAADRPDESEELAADRRDDAAVMLPLR